MSRFRKALNTALSIFFPNLDLDRLGIGSEQPMAGSAFLAEAIEFYHRTGRFGRLGQAVQQHCRTQSTDIAADHGNCRWLSVMFKLLYHAWCLPCTEFGQVCPTHYCGRCQATAKFYKIFCE